MADFTELAEKELRTKERLAAAARGDGAGGDGGARNPALDFDDSSDSDGDSFADDRDVRKARGGAGVALGEEEDEYDSELEISDTEDPRKWRDLLDVCDHIGAFEEEYGADGSPTGREVFRCGEDTLDCLRFLVKELHLEANTGQARHCPKRKRLGRFEVFQNKFIPLCVAYHQDKQILYQATKLMAVLTMLPDPLSTEQDLQMKHLLKYKEAMLNADVIAVFVGMLEEPLQRMASEPTEADSRIVELVLSLFLNLLKVPNPAPSAASAKGHLSTLDETFVLLLHKEHVLETFLALAESIEDNNQRWALLLLDVFHTLLPRKYTAKQLIKARDTAERALSDARSRGMLARSKDRSDGAAAAEGEGDTEADVASTLERLGSRIAPTLRKAMSRADDPLLRAAKQESSRHRKTASALQSRHSRFGGAIATVVGNRRQLQYNMFRDKADMVPQAKRRTVARNRKKPKMQVDEALVNRDATSLTSVELQVRNALYDFATTFLSTGYEPLMGNVKRLIAKQAQELLPKDTTDFLHLVGFCMSLHRSLQHRRLYAAARAARKDKSRSAKKSKDGKPAVFFEAGPMVVSLDRWSFNRLVLEVDAALAAKNYANLAAGGGLLKEMLSMLHELETSTDTVMHTIGTKLRRTVFRNSAMLELVPRLLNKWEPRTFTRSFVSDLVESAHVLLKMATALEEEGAQVVRRRRMRKEGAGSDDEDKEFKEMISSFSLANFTAKFVEPRILAAYTELFRQFETNTPRLNHCIVSWFTRIQATVDTVAGVDYKGDTITFEWAMYSLPMLQACHGVLDHPVCSGKVKSSGDREADAVFAALGSFARRLVRKFFAAAQDNHLLFAEVFFTRTRRQHAILARGYRERMTAMEMRMAQRAAREDIGRGERGSSAEEEVSDQAADSDALDDADFGPLNEEEAKDAIGMKKPSRRKPREKRAGGTPKRKTTKRWSAEEDDALRALYPRFADSGDAAYDLLSVEDIFSERERTPEQLKRRVKYLRLLAPKKRVRASKATKEAMERARAALNDPSVASTDVAAVQKAAGVVLRTPAELVAQGEESDPATPKRVIEWLIDCVSRCLRARRVSGVVSGRARLASPRGSGSGSASDSAPAESDSDSEGGAESDLDGVGTGRAPFAFVPVAAAQFTWLAAPCVQALMRKLRARPPSPASGESFWRIAADVSNGFLRSARMGMRAAIASEAVARERAAAAAARPAVEEAEGATAPVEAAGAAVLEGGGGGGAGAGAGGAAGSVDEPQMGDTSDDDADDEAQDADSHVAARTSGGAAAGEVEETPSQPPKRFKSPIAKASKVHAGAKQRKRLRMRRAMSSDSSSDESDVHETLPVDASIEETAAAEASQRRRIAAILDSDDSDDDAAGAPLTAGGKRTGAVLSSDSESDADAAAASTPRQSPRKPSPSKRSRTDAASTSEERAAAGDAGAGAGVPADTVDTVADGTDEMEQVFSAMDATEPTDIHAASDGDE